MVEVRGRFPSRKSRVRWASYCILYLGKLLIFFGEENTTLLALFPACGKLLARVVAFKIYFSTSGTSNISKYNRMLFWRRSGRGREHRILGGERARLTSHSRNTILSYDKSFSNSISDFAKPKNFMVSQGELNKSTIRVV